MSHSILYNICRFFSTLGNLLGFLQIRKTFEQTCFCRERRARFNHVDKDKDEDDDEADDEDDNDNDKEDNYI